MFAKTATAKDTGVM